ncbi:hypothetical protein TAMC210_10080 [Thermanaeromonas sp. C210]|nr:hypothetical protein TAMC210_10080 [Thermanaeromonas sp. C210]
MLSSLPIYVLIHSFKEGKVFRPNGLYRLDGLDLLLLEGLKQVAFDGVLCGKDHLGVKKDYACCRLDG